MTDPSVDSLLLTGGLSTRMGTDKAFLHINDKPLIQHLYAQLKRLNQRVFIAANQLQAQIKEQCPDAVFVSDQFAGNEGPLSGILPALNKTTADYLWVTPIDCFGDLACIKDTLINGLNTTQADIVFLSVDGREQPLLSLIKTDLKDSLNTYLHKGKRGVYRWFLTENHAIIPWASNDRFIANINHPEDVANLIQQQNH